MENLNVQDESRVYCQFMDENGSYFFGHENGNLIQRRWIALREGGMLFMYNHTKSEYAVLFYSSESSREVKVFQKDGKKIGEFIETKKIGEGSVAEQEIIIGDPTPIIDFVRKGLLDPELVSISQPTRIVA